MRGPFKTVMMAAVVCLMILAAGLLVLIFGRMDRTVEVRGRVVPQSSVSVSAGVTGVVDSVYIHEGDSVSRGDTILTLTNDDLHLDVERARQELSLARRRLQQLRDEQQTLTASQSYESSATLADIEAARLRMELAQKAYKRQQKLYEKDLISKEEEEEARLTYEVAKSTYRVLSERHDMVASRYDRLITDQRETVALAEQSCRLAEDKLSRTVVTSPVAGVLITRKPDNLTGTRAEAGVPLVTIADLSQVRFAAEVSEGDMPDVSPGLPIKVHVTAFPHREYKVFRGEVVEISTAPVATQSPAVYEAVLSIDEPWVRKDGRRLQLLPGMSGTAEIILEPEVRIISLLIEAIEERS
jgi:multidrug resistance efflux pump